MPLPENSKHVDLRDKIAMSMSVKAIPQLNGDDAVLEFTNAHNINFDIDDTLSMIEFGMKYQAIIRYQYADAMLAQRTV